MVRYLINAHPDNMPLYISFGGMSMEHQFYICKQCGNITAFVKNSGVPIVCCGKKMVELIPGTTDASKEKHIPVWELSGDTVTVTVGEAVHPMEAAHYIEWVALSSDSGMQYRWLSFEDEPRARFALDEGDSVRAVYAWCNLHGLWKA